MMNKKGFFMDAETAYLENETIYLFGRHLNILFSYDLNSGKVKIFGKVPKYNFVFTKLIGRILKWNNKIILLPLAANELWIYDIENNEWQEIEIENASSYELLFYQGFVYNDEVHLIGCYYPAIVRINMKTMELSYDKRIYEEIDTFEDKNDSIYFRTEYIRDDKIITMGCCNINRIMQYNLDNYEYKLIETGDQGNDYEGLTLMDDHIVMFGRHEQCIYNLEGRQEKKEIPAEIDCHYMATIVKDGRYIFLSSIVGNSCVIEDGKFLINNEKCFFCEKLDNKNYVYMSDKHVLNVVRNDKEILSKVLYLEDEEEKKILDLVVKSQIIEENEFVDLERFMTVLCLKESKQGGPT